MLNLTDPNISYLIISPESNKLSQLDNHITCERVCSILYSKDYTIIPINSYKNGLSDRSFIAISPNSNDDIRFDSIYLMDKFDCNSTIVKYRGEYDAVLIEKSGAERLLGLNIYDSNIEKKAYILEGVSFTFDIKKRYFFPKEKSELKNGMILEYFNNNKWTQKTVSNIDTEYDKLYKLLMKYQKIRIECP